MFPNLKLLGITLWISTIAGVVEAQSPLLSASFAPPSYLRLAWPSNFTSAGWQLESAVTPASLAWYPVPVTPFVSNDASIVVLPMTTDSSFYRLRKVGIGSCVFQATPQVINAGDSSLLTWCPVDGSTYQLSPGPGMVSGGTFSVSPATTTTYSLTASNDLGVVLTNNTTVIVNPCGWLQLVNLDVDLFLDYKIARSTPSYNFNIEHHADVTFHLHRQSVTATDAYFLGFTTSDPVLGTVLDWTLMKDRKDDKTGPTTFTTTEVGGPGAPSLHNVSTFSLHLTCDTYDFSYNVLMNTTETSQFGTFHSPDGVGAGRIVTRALPSIDALANIIGDYAAVPAEYPPNSGDYFTPSSDLGKQMFNTGVVTSTTAGEANVSWGFYPVP